MNKTRSHDSLCSSPVIDQIRLWLLRLLVPLGAHRKLLGKHGFGNDDIAGAIGLAAWLEIHPDEFNLIAAQAALRKAYARAERKRDKALSPIALQANLKRLAELVGLTNTDCRILEFAVLIRNDRLLDSTAELLGGLTSAKVAYAMAVLLDLPEADVKAALSVNGLLARSGLVTADCLGFRPPGEGFLRSSLGLLSPTFAERMLSEEEDVLSLLRDTVRLSALPHLALEDFAHIGASLKILRPYLHQAVKEKRRGINIFVYGPPGTGKTQLAQVLAKDIGCALFEISSESADQDPIEGKLRLRAFRIAQSFLSRRKALILFDEVEDVFDDGDSFFGHKSAAQASKAWMNRMLEENLVPTLWLSNSVGGLEAAFVRRFDMVIELKAPPQNIRERLVQDVCCEYLPPDMITHMAANESLTPAVITRAAAVVSSIREEISAPEAADAFELLVNSTLKAQGHKIPKKKGESDGIPEHYDLAFINADTDLEKLVAGVVRSKGGRLCLYGPPGTGKTAFGVWLADQLGVPLAVKRGSDLLSKWVGGTEQNIARAFREAKEEEAVLLLDEVDSLLRDRRGAQRSWEVTEVNEMLTQMESFPGVFIASTNLMDGLDQAALRRFDLKVQFNYLGIEQAWKLFRRHCAAIDLGEPDVLLRQNLAQLGALAPGDFAAVARQHRFRPIVSPAMFVAALQAECGFKENGRKASIGFV